MKKFMVCLVLFFLGLCVSAKESPFYAKTVFIYKITSHQKGYRVNYLTNRGDPVTVYLPMQWFYKKSSDQTDDGSVKAEMLYRYGPQHPYMTIFWKEGKFHHVRICANANVSDNSWGSLKDGEDITHRFDPSQEINFLLEK